MKIFRSSYLLVDKKLSDFVKSYIDGRFRKTKIRIIFEDIYRPSRLFDFYWWSGSFDYDRQSKYKSINLSGSDGYLSRVTINSKGCNEIHNQISLKEAIKKMEKINKRPVAIELYDIYDISNDSRVIANYELYGVNTYERSDLSGFLYEKIDNYLLEVKNKDEIKNSPFGLVINNSYPFFNLKLLPFSSLDKMVITKISPKKPCYEIRDIEIEAKFQPITFSQYKMLYSYFLTCEGKEFKIESRFEYVFKRYLSVSFINEHVRYIFPFTTRGGKLRIKYELPAYRPNKTNTMIRKEIDSYYFLNPHEIINKPFLKGKLMFWVENINSSRIYHLVLDKEFFPQGSSLSQFEIEYAGKIKSLKNCYKETNDYSKIIPIIISEINELTKEIEKIVPISPTCITKYEALQKLSTYTTNLNNRVY